MLLRQAGRHRPRSAVAHLVTISDRRGRNVVRARVAELGHTSLFCVTEARRALGLKDMVTVTIHLPPSRSARRPHGSNRAVRYLGRIIETQEIGQIVGLNVQLVEKLD